MFLKNKSKKPKKVRNRKKDLKNKQKNIKLKI